MVTTCVWLTRPPGPLTVAVMTASPGIVQVSAKVCVGLSSVCVTGAWSVASQVYVSGVVAVIGLTVVVKV